MLISSSFDSIKNWSLHLSIQLKPQIKFGFLKIKKSTIVLKMHEDVVSKVTYQEIFYHLDGTLRIVRLETNQIRSSSVKLGP